LLAEARQNRGQNFMRIHRDLFLTTFLGFITLAFIFQISWQFSDGKAFSRGLKCAASSRRFFVLYFCPFSFNSFPLHGIHSTISTTMPSSGTHVQIYKQQQIAMKRNGNKFFKYSS
jgi:hypothetical protein